MITVDNISKTFNGKPVLSSVSLTAQPGELLGIIGPSGAGKSTLLRCINHLEGIDEGRIVVGDTEILAATHLDSNGAAHLRRQVGIVFQHLNLWPYRTALQNIVEGAIHGKDLPKGQAIYLAHEWAKRLGIADQLHKWPAELSGGQRQRVAIARAVIMEPKFALLDEITSALDPILAGQLADIMVELKRTGIGIIAVTHQIDFIRRSADRIYFLHCGRIVESGTREILTQPSTPELREFLRSVQHGW